MCFKKSSHSKVLHKILLFFFLTFKEDKIPLAVFINCINVGRKSPPEVGNLHGVSIHHPVVPDSPKPLILETKQTLLTIFVRVQLLSWKYWTAYHGIFRADFLLSGEAQCVCICLTLQMFQNWFLLSGG